MKKDIPFTENPIQQNFEIKQNKNKQTNKN